MLMTVAIPTINDGFYDFHTIYRIYNQIVRSNDDVMLDFSSCRFLRQNACAFIVGISIWLKGMQRRVQVYWGSCDARVKANLARNGFTRYFDLDYSPYGSTNIELRWFHKETEDGVVADYLSNSWLRREWLDVSNDLNGAIVGNVYELFANSFEHSKSVVGLFTCGQYYPNRKEIALSVVDFGVGIPGNVRRHLAQGSMPARETFLWALKRGNSTRVGAPGGLGLDMLKEFLALNEGEMAVYSRDGFFRWFGRKEEYGVMSSDFHGTIVNLRLKCDGRHYQLG